MLSPVFRCNLSLCHWHVIVISNCHWLSDLTSHGHVTCWACHSFSLTLTWRCQEVQDHRHGLQWPLVHERGRWEDPLGPMVLREGGQGAQPDLPQGQTFHGHFVKIWFDVWVELFCFWFCFVDLIDFVLWILWILFCGFMDFIFDCVCLWILLCGFMDFVNFVLWNFALWIYGCCFWFCFVIYCGLFCGFCFVDLWILCLMSVGLWSLWIFVWCCNSGDGFAPEWSGPAVEALVGEGGDRSEEAEAFAVVRRWSGAASVSHRRWANIGRLDLDHVSRWKWRILSLRRGWPGILEWRCLTTSSFGMAKSLTSSFGMTKSKIWHRLLHRVALNAMVSNLCPIRANARGLENKPAVGWTHVCMCMLSLTMFACALSLLMFCLSCFVAHCFSLVSHVVTWIWQLRFDGFFVFLNFKRSDASGRLHGKKGCCACLCMSFRFWNLVSVHVCACRLRVCACPCLKVVAPVMNVFGKGFGFPWHPQVCTLINAL